MAARFGNHMSMYSLSLEKPKPTSPEKIIKIKIQLTITELAEKEAYIN